MKSKLLPLTLLLFIACGNYSRSTDPSYAAVKNLYRKSVSAESQGEKHKLRSEIIKLSPGSEYGLFAQAWFLYRYGDFKGSVELYTKAIKLNPEEPLFYYNRAVSSFTVYKNSENGKYLALAVSDLEKSIELDPLYAPSYSLRAKIRSLMNNYNSAVADYTSAINLKGDDPELYYSRGLARLRGNNDSRGAIADASKAIELDPRFAEAYCLRGLARLSLDDKKGACSDYRKAESLDPGSCLFGGDEGLIPGCTD